jgi:hypothetical protein
MAASIKHEIKCEHGSNLPQPEARAVARDIGPLMEELKDEVNGPYKYASGAIIGGNFVKHYPMGQHTMVQVEDGKNNLYCQMDFIAALRMKERIKPNPKDVVIIGGLYPRLWNGGLLMNGCTLQIVRRRK